MRGWWVVGGVGVVLELGVGLGGMGVCWGFFSVIFSFGGVGLWLGVWGIEFMIYVFCVVVAGRFGGDWFS